MVLVILKKLQNFCSQFSIQSWSLILLPTIKAADILSLRAASKAERRKLLFFSMSKFFTSPNGFLCSSVERTHDIHRRDLQTVLTTVAIESIMIIRLSFGFSWQPHLIGPDMKLEIFCKSIDQFYYWYKYFKTLNMQHELISKTHFT